MVTNRDIRHIFGPVPSRRLGLSLGLDVIPAKTCPFDCIYCQIGKTTHHTTRPDNFVTAAELLKELRVFLDQADCNFDCLTFSGSGEPTLNSELEDMLVGVRQLTDKPSVVITGGSLMAEATVRRALRLADVVMPSLDSAVQATFEAVNRPVPGLVVAEIIRGMEIFRSEFSGQMRLEVLFVKGYNDRPDEIEALKSAIERIQPDTVEINTVVRPPAEKFALTVGLAELEQIRAALGHKARIIADFKRAATAAASPQLDLAIIAVISRRPVTLDDLVLSLGAQRTEIVNHLKMLISKGRVQPTYHDQKEYYTLAQTLA
ncbi:MAG: radical SAM protein [Deltaproteobacteria bacterium]|nr:radical SAM protein [Deltaproteobacteria bacterium]